MIIYECRKGGKYKINIKKLIDERKIIMKMELIKKLSDDVFADKKQHLMASRIALIMSLVPILSQIMSIFKVNYVIAHMFGAVNALCILCSFVLSVLCIKNQKNRNFMNVCSIIISGFFMLVVAVLMAIGLIYTIAYVVKH